MIKRLLEPYLFYIKIAAVILTIAAIITIYFKWKWAIEEAAVSKITIKQLEQNIKDQDEAINILKKQIEVTNNVLKERDKNIEVLNEELNKILFDIDNSKNEEKVPSIIVDTIEKLKKK